MEDSIPRQLDLLQEKLWAGDHQVAKEIATKLYQREGRAKIRCWNTLISFAATHTAPSEKCLFHLLNKNINEIKAVELLSAATKSKEVIILLKETEPSSAELDNVITSYNQNLYDLSLGKNIDINILTMLFLRIHRSSEYIDPKNYAGYKKLPFLCMYPFATFNFSSEVKTYTHTLFNYILSNKNWRWREKSEKLYMSFLLWLYETQVHAR